MIDKERIEKIVEDLTKGKEIFIVDINIGTDNRINVLLDKPDGITINECAQISRFIEGKLDRWAEDFELQVSSPGLTSPFRVIEQYKKNRGKKIEVVTKEGLKKRGILKKVNSEGIEIEVKFRQKEGKRKKVIRKEEYLTYDKIKSTKVVIAF